MKLLTRFGLALLLLPSAALGAGSPVSMAEIKEWRKLPMPERVNHLIEGLDRIDSMFVINDAVPNIEYDMLPGDLIEEFYRIGDPAVEPLLKCATTDTRKTQFTMRMFMGVSHTKPIPGEFKTLSVAEAALGIASEIVGDPDEHLTLDSLEAFWKKTKKYKGLNRYAALLADKDLKPGLWYNAIQLLATKKAKGRWASPFAGQTADPTIQTSVSHSVVERIKECDNDRSRIYVSEMATMLAQWDQNAALPSLKLVTDHEFPHIMNAVFSWRIKLGDANAVQDYLDWYQKVDKQGQDFLPFLLFPKDPKLAAAVPSKLQSTYAVLKPETNLHAPGAVQRALEQLQERSVVGTTFRKGLTISAERGIGMQSWLIDGFYLPQGLVTKDGFATRESIRPSNQKLYIADNAVSDILACDGMASALASQRKATFSYGWSRENRDKAVAETIKWLESRSALASK